MYINISEGTARAKEKNGRNIIRKKGGKTEKNFVMNGLLCAQYPKSGGIFAYLYYITYSLCVYIYI